jgi:hypothetical protein
MIPAAPLVGAVTTRPPAAFSSFTASAYRLTQSSTVSGSRIAASGLRTVRVQRRRAPRDVQAAGQGAGLADAARHAVLHRGPDLAQPGDHLVVAAPGAFVLEHQLRDRQARGRATREQLVATGERMRRPVVSATMRSSAASSWLTTKPPPTE